MGCWGMTDFRPGDYRVLVEHERGITGWIFGVLALVLLAAAASIYLFRPEWIAAVADLAGLSAAGTSVQGSQPDAEFTALYQKYQMAPLDRSAASSETVAPLLAGLQKEPCDKQTASQASIALENIRATRGAAEMMKGFADACPDGGVELYHASELYYLLGDYDTAVKLSTDVINHQPDAQNPYYVRARSEQAQKQYAAAVEDYATLIRLMPNSKNIVAEVFTRMSDSYEKLDRPCEAIAPLQTYIALDSEKRSTPQLQKRIATLAAQGHCAQVYAKGQARIPRRSSGVSIATVQINGVEGKFAIDTGASFVTLSRGFAAKCKPRMLLTDSVQMQTANGAAPAALASLDSVKVAGLSASGVPAVVIGKSLGDNVDGLLGMSFLSRFTVVIDEHDVQLKAKTLAE
jgi:clan AA aspartic protease (TIGR02281 family)